MHYHSVELSLYEIGFSRSPLLSSASDMGFQRLEILCQLITATKNWIGAFFTISPSLFYDLSIVTFTQVAHLLIIIHKLATFESPEWDLEQARNMISFPDTVRQFKHWFELVRSSVDVDESTALDGQHLFSRTAKKFDKLLAWYDAKIAVDAMGPEISSRSDGDTALTGEQIDEYLDEAFLSSLLGDWQYQVDSL